MLTVEEQIRLIADAAMDALDLDTAAGRRATPHETVLDNRPGADTRSPVQFPEEVVTMIDVKTTGPAEPGPKRPMRVVVAGILAAAAAVVAIAFVVIRDPDHVAPSPAVAPTTVAPTTVAPRTETGSFSGDDGVPLTFTVPDGWAVFQGWLVQKEEVCCPRYAPGPAVAFMEVTNIYAAGCLVGPPVGPTVDDLVSALANVPGLNATAAVDVTVDGYAGKQIEFTVLYYKEGECRGNPNPYALWYAPGDAAPGFEEAIRFDPNTINIHNKLWILDVGGTRVVIHAFSYGSMDRAALDEVLSSIQIG